MFIWQICYIVNYILKKKCHICSQMSLRNIMELPSCKMKKVWHFLLFRIEINTLLNLMLVHPNSLQIYHSNHIHANTYTQDTTTHDFSCSVSESTSSTGSIHVNSPDSVNKFGVIPVKSWVFHVMKRFSETVPALAQFDLWQQAEHVYSHE